MINSESLFEEILCLRRDITRDSGGSRRPNPEYSLHLCELGPWVFAREHLDDQTADTPNVSFMRVSTLLDDFGGHPEYRTL